jgi:hypothetical protein
MRRFCQLALILFPLAIFTVSARAQEAELLAFAKANTGKFQSEVKGLPRFFVVRARPFDGWWQFAEFDQHAGKLIKDIGGNVWSLWLYERCTPSGSYAGQNSFGVKANVQKLSCQRLEIQDINTTGVVLGDLDCSFTDRLAQDRSEEERATACKDMNARRIQIPMTASQYRSVKSAGVLYEVDFEVGPDVDEEVATETRLTLAPTIAAPLQKSIHVLRVAGKLMAIRVLTADGKTQLAKYTR